MTWDTEDYIRLGELLILAVSGGFGYYGLTREGRERRKDDREEDAELNKTLKDLRTDVNTLYGQNKELWLTVQSLQNQVAERDKKIREQQEQIERQQGQIEERDEVIQIHEKHIEEARVRITELETQLKAVQNGTNGDSSSEGPMV